MSADHYDEINIFLGDVSGLLMLLREPGALAATPRGKFIADMVERLTPQLEQSLKDLHHPAVRRAIIETPEE